MKMSGLVTMGSAHIPMATQILNFPASATGKSLLHRQQFGGGSQLSCLPFGRQPV